MVGKGTIFFFFGGGGRGLVTINSAISQCFTLRVVKEVSTF